ncbi:MAG: hypothetical protein ACR2OY_04640 [Boseongicola sp.]
MRIPAQDYGKISSKRAENGIPWDADLIKVLNEIAAELGKPGLATDSSPILIEV